MKLQNPSNGGTKTVCNPVFPVSSTIYAGEASYSTEAHRFSEDFGSTCSTPYVSAPSSPGRGPPSYFYSAPASPTHYMLSGGSAAFAPTTSSEACVSASFEFEFSSRFSSNGSAAVGSMSSADELFLNGQIRPMKLSTHLQRPQILAPLLDLDGEDEDEETPREGKDLKEEQLGKCESAGARGRDLRLRSRSVHRKTRSLSPLRDAAEFQWQKDDGNGDRELSERVASELEDRERRKQNSDVESTIPSTETTPSGSASSSRSSSSGRNSKKWIFLKDLLYRSKSEGSENSKEKYFWSSMSFSPAKEIKLPPLLSKTSSLNFFSKRDNEKEKPPTTNSSAASDVQKDPENNRSKRFTGARKGASGKPANGVAKRRIPPSPHELHYTANRAQAEEMKKKTFLPYRQGLLGCLGFSSKGYGALNGLTKSLNPVSSG
ncbi:uncharacterized protein LOC131155439 [Malania oleifera]|uniref:uncharacterized protein LOC131155439 n=1 Tax=Malania oleifera TaxID=397392 RepID=UPI0025ADC2D1|nr:uncharacterized protein LOC131155439 [Malania oleifera]